MATSESTTYFDIHSNRSYPPALFAKKKKWQVKGSNPSLKNIDSSSIDKDLYRWAN